MRSRKPEPSDPASTEAEQGFYARWSRRKRRVRDGVDDDTDAPRVDRGEQAMATGETSSPPEPPLTDADMPPLESLDGDSDFSGFMSPEVSEELRNKALRKLFLSAQFNVVDGLDDYDDDFTVFEALGDVITSDMRHQQELAEQRAREASERAAIEDEATPVEQQRMDDAATARERAEPVEPPAAAADEDGSARVVAADSSARDAPSEDNDAEPQQRAARSEDDQRDGAERGNERT